MVNRDEDRDGDGDAILCSPVSLVPSGNLQVPAAGQLAARKFADLAATVGSARSGRTHAPCKSYKVVVVVAPCKVLHSHR